MDLESRECRVPSNRSGLAFPFQGFSALASRLEFFCWGSEQRKKRSKGAIPPPLEIVGEDEAGDRQRAPVRDALSWPASSRFGPADNQNGTTPRWQAGKVEAGRQAFMPPAHGPFPRANSDTPHGIVVQPKAFPSPSRPTDFPTAGLW